MLVHSGCSGTKAQLVDGNKRKIIARGRSMADGCRHFARVAAKQHKRANTSGELKGEASHLY